jgi:hypothetical protein
MNTDKRDSEAKRFIKTMLGESNMDIELQDKDYEIIEMQTMNVIAPYYEGTKYILGTAPTIDLSNYPEVTEIHSVLTSHEDSSADFLQTLFFGQPGVYIWDSNTMDNYLQYVSLQTMYANFVPMKSYTWKFIPPKVYLHGYTGNVILECFVRPTKFSDIDKASAMYPLAQEYALALAKEIVGRTRSRFTVAGSPYQLDGAALLQEAQAEKASVLERIIPPIRIY